MLFRLYINSSCNIKLLTFPIPLHHTVTSDSTPSHPHLNYVVFEWHPKAKRGVRWIEPKNPRGKRKWNMDKYIRKNSERGLLLSPVVPTLGRRKSGARFQYEAPVLESLWHLRRTHGMYCTSVGQKLRAVTTSSYSVLFSYSDPLQLLCDVLLTPTTTLQCNLTRPTTLRCDLIHTPTPWCTFVPYTYRAMWYDPTTTLWRTLHPAPTVVLVMYPRAILHLHPPWYLPRTLHVLYTLHGVRTVLYLQSIYGILFVKWLVMWTQITSQGKFIIQNTQK